MRVDQRAEAIRRCPIPGQAIKFVAARREAAQLERPRQPTRVRDDLDRVEGHRQDEVEHDVRGERGHHQDGEVLLRPDRRDGAGLRRREGAGEPIELFGQDARIEQVGAPDGGARILRGNEPIPVALEGADEQGIQRGERHRRSINQTK
ncbi:hypothetical protein R1A27_09410 [Methylobacterium sp. NMS12]|uniref:hypothetical protein n=1 Tax=Methylobacterium sp. NMS12 TaxID=3079766 RepID=UPI003F88385B